MYAKIWKIIWIFWRASACYRRSPCQKELHFMKAHGVTITSLFVKTMSQRRFDVIMTLLLRRMSTGFKLVAHMVLSDTALDHKLLHSLSTALWEKRPYRRLLSCTEIPFKQPAGSSEESVIDAVLLFTAVIFENVTAENRSSLEIRERLLILCHHWSRFIHFGC